MKFNEQINWKTLISPAFSVFLLSSKSTFTLLLQKIEYILLSPTEISHFLHKTLSSCLCWSSSTRSLTFWPNILAEYQREGEEERKRIAMVFIVLVLCCGLSLSAFNWGYIFLDGPPGLPRSLSPLSSNTWGSSHYDRAERNLTSNMKMQFQSLALISGSRIWCSHELWCRSQMKLGSCVAVVVV